MSSRAARGFGIVAGLLGVALAVDSFSTWFTISGAPVDMWQAFDFVDILVGMTVAASIAAGISAVVGERGGTAIVLATISANVSFLTLILVCWRSIDPPGIEAVRESGVWLGLALTAAILAASAGAMGGGSPPRLSSTR